MKQYFIIQIIVDNNHDNNGQNMTSTCTKRHITQHITWIHGYVVVTDAAILSVTNNRQQSILKFMGMAFSSLCDKKVVVLQSAIIKINSTVVPQRLFGLYPVCGRKVVSFTCLSKM